MDPDDVSVSIGDTSDESELEEEPTSEDERGIDDSLQPSADDVNLYRAMEQEQQQAEDAPESLDAAFAGMRMEAERRRQREEG